MLKVDFLSVFVAALALIVTIYTAYLQRVHNRTSIKPICTIIEKYHRHNIAILIVNQGLGAMIIDKISVRKGRAERDNLIEFMPKVDQMWNGFSLEIEGRAILPNQELVLCAIDPKSDAIHQKILDALMDIEIDLYFHDAYNQIQRVKKKLSYPKVFVEDFGYIAK